jgi:hypothetical protein
MERTALVRFRHILRGIPLVSSQHRCVGRSNLCPWICVELTTVVYERRSFKKGITCLIYKSRYSSHWNVTIRDDNHHETSNADRYSVSTAAMSSIHQPQIETGFLAEASIMDVSSIS